MEDDFAATTTIGERVVPLAPTRKQPTATQGPTFGIPSKLEPFCLLAKSARGAGTANLVTQVTSAPGVFVFSELLELPSIKDLANGEHVSSYQLLELFAYGTWNDYVEKRDSLPPLNKAQETKLKHLTILSLAMTNRIIPYSTLLSTLSLSTIPSLEDLLIEGFYTNIFTGRLDQKLERLEVLSTTGRDVRPSSPSSSDEMEVEDTTTTNALSATSYSVESLTTSLTTWLETISSMLNSLDRHLVQIVTEANQDAVRQAEYEAAVLGMIQEVSNGSTGGGGGGGGKSGGGKEKERERESSGKDGGGGGGWMSQLGLGKVLGGSGGKEKDKEEMDVDKEDAEGGSAGSTRGAKSAGSAGGRAKKRGRV